MSRIQDARSAETRKRLLDATVDCLYERGYAGTTTAEIAARAGVSKGAQIHHFPTKEQLVISALEYLLDMRVAASSDPEAIRALPRNPNKRLAAIVDMLVPVYRSKVFYAWLELLVASRTDIGLRQAIRRLGVGYAERILEVWKTLFGSPADDPQAFRIVDRVLNGQFAAMALGDILNGGESDEATTRENVAAIKEIGVSLLPKTKRARRP